MEEATLLKIKETVERECCQTRDLRPIHGSPIVGRIPKYMFCVHCGRQHEMHTFTDAAGSSDWEYRPRLNPWVTDYDKER